MVAPTSIQVGDFTVSALAQPMPNNWEKERLRLMVLWQETGRLVNICYFSNEGMECLSRALVKQMIILNYFEQEEIAITQTDAPFSRSLVQNYLRITNEGIRWIDSITGAGQITAQGIHLTSAQISSLKRDAEWQRGEGKGAKRWCLERFIDAKDVLLPQLQSEGYIKRREIDKDIISQTGGPIFRFTKSGLAWADTLVEHPQDEK